jgi:hypothetical protein
MCRVGFWSVPGLRSKYGSKHTDVYRVHMLEAIDSLPICILQCAICILQKILGNMVLILNPSDLENNINIATPYGYFDENLGKPGQTLLIFTPTTQPPCCAQPYLSGQLHATLPIKAAARKSCCQRDGSNSHSAPECRVLLLTNDVFELKHPFKSISSKSEGFRI